MARRYASSATIGRKPEFSQLQLRLPDALQHFAPAASPDQRLHRAACARPLRIGQRPVARNAGSLTGIADREGLRRWIELSDRERRREQTRPPRSLDGGLRLRTTSVPLPSRQLWRLGRTSHRNHMRACLSRQKSPWPNPLRRLAP
jgi:hypothetical protein